jgi:hypothetical protein
MLRGLPTELCEAQSSMSVLSYRNTINTAFLVAPCQSLLRGQGQCKHPHNCKPASL